MRKGIILAGGAGTRLWPITRATSKQLLPVYDKPMLYYPLTTLMLAGIREIAVITTPHDEPQFKDLLGDGSQWGVTLEYIPQPSPDGLAQAYILAENFLNGAPSALILGDNLFFGSGLRDKLRYASGTHSMSTVFGFRVNNPRRYGVVEFDDAQDVKTIVEKPENPPSNIAVSGLYFLDGRASEIAKEITPSSRGELEITDLLQRYIDAKSLRVQEMGRGYAWFDTGTHESLLDAGNFVRTIFNRQGVQIGCPEEIAYLQSWISVQDLKRSSDEHHKTEYGEYLSQLAAGTDL